MQLDSKANDGENLYLALVAAKIPAEADRPAIRAGSDRLSYGALDTTIQEIRSRLVSAGVRAGDRVLLRLPNSPFLIASALAVAAEDAIAVPLHHTASDSRTRWVIGSAAPRVCLTGSGFAAEPAPAESVELVTGSREGGAALILFTSGSTGRPKGALLTHRALLWSARSLADLFGFTPDHRELIVSPLTHSGAWQRALATLAAGGEICIFEGRLTVPHLLEACAGYAATGFYTPPHLIRYLINGGERRVREGLSTLRGLEIGSAAIAEDELARLLVLLPGADVFVHYGLTECPRITVLNAREHADKLRTVGQPRRGCEVAIADEAGQHLVTGQSGEILVRGLQMAESYWPGPGLTATTVNDGWLATGDHGELDEDGFLIYRGRRDDLINCSGYSFFPTEVEIELGPQVGVAEYLVARVSDPSSILGQVPVALVVPTDPGVFDPSSFLASARAALPSHMVPREVVVVESLPKTNSGKPDRKRATEQLARGGE